MKWLERFARSPRSDRPTATHNPRLLLALEPRMMFDGAIAATTADVVDNLPTPTDTAQDAPAQDDTLPMAAAGSDSRRELVFIDARIQDAQQLIAGLPAGSEVVLLDGQRSGLEQIAEYLDGRSGIDAIHLLSHGEAGVFRAGSDWIDAHALAAQSATLARIGAALSEHGDILLYGCKTGEGAAGAALVNELARLTQADVAASSDNTGALALGGDWVLETRSGSIDSIALAPTAFSGLLAAPTSLNFDSVNLSADADGDPTRSFGGSPRVFDGWTVTLHNSAGTMVTEASQDYLDVTNNTGDNDLVDGAGDKALTVQGFLGSAASARFTATSGEEFWLQSFVIQNINMNSGVRVEGYREGNLVASHDFTLNGGLGVYSTITLDHLGDQDWQNIDQFRIVQQNGSADLWFAIDDIVVAPKVLPNTPPTATNLTQGVTVTEGGSTVALSDIVITDPDASDTLTATLTLSSPAAGALSTGTFGSATSSYNPGTGVWSVTGSRTDVNAALAAVALTPSADNDQNFTITTRIRDAANSGPADGIISVSVTGVNDVPSATNLNQSKAVTEGGGAVALDDIVVSDPDTGDTITATLTLSSPAAGSLSTGTFGAATSTYDAGTGVWTVSGSRVDVNAALAAVALTPSADNEQNFTIATRIRDAANSGPADGSITVSVTAVNDAPVVSTSGGNSSFIENAGGSVIDASLTLSDVDNATLASARVAITGNFASGQDVLAFVNDGSMGNISASYDAGTGVLTLTSASASATLAQWQAALRSVTYSNGSDAPSTAARTISFRVNDGTADSNLATKVLNVTAVNDAPQITAPATLSVTEDQASVLTGISFSDPDAGANPVTAIFSVPSGMLTATSGGAVTVLGSGSSSLTLTGTLANVNAFIAGNKLSYTTAANATANVTLSIGINDGGNTGSGGAQTDSQTVTLQVTAVNDAPLITAPPSIAVSEDVSSALTSISFADPDAGSNTVTATFSVPSGTLSATSSGSVTVGGTSSALTLSGSLADLNAFIAAGQLSFQTATNATANVVLSISINDGGNTGGGALTDSTTLTLAVTAVNDAPVNSLPAAQSVNQDATLVFSSGNGNLISISDVDAGAGILSVTLVASYGQLSLAGITGLTFSTGDGSNDGVMTFNGTLIDINNALNGLSYSPATGYNGPAILQISTSDLGLSGSGGTRIDTDTIQITVNPINPVITAISSSNADGTYKVGDVITISTTFDQVVTVDTNGGIPSLLLETGSIDRAATYVSGSGSTTLTFLYTVQAGDSSADLDVQSTAALALNGATLRNALSQDAVLTLPATGSANSIAGQHDLVIDGVAPSVTSVGVPASATYVAGQNLDFTVNFSEAITVDTSGGTPRLAITLDTGGTVYASYLSGSGSNALVFRHTLASGVQDTNGISLAGSIDGNGGQLRDGAGNLALNTLNGVAATTGVLVDSRAPVVVSLAPQVAQVDSGSATFTLQFDENVSGVDLADLQLAGSASGTLQSLTQIDPRTYQITVTNISGRGSLNLVLNAAGSGISDAMGNALGSSFSGSALQVGRQGGGLDGGDPEFRSNPPVTVHPPVPLPPVQAPPPPPAPTSPLLPPPLFTPPSPGGGLPTVGTIFIGEGSNSPSFIAQVFASSDSGGDGSGSGFLGFGGGDGGVFGSSSLAGAFSGSGPSLPVSLFGGSTGGFGSLDGGELRQIFGAPSLSQQLHDHHAREARQVATLTNALEQLGNA